MCNIYRQVVVTHSAKHVKRRSGVRTRAEGYRCGVVGEGTPAEVVTEHYSFTVRNTITEDKVTNTFANEDKTTIDAATSRTRLALCSRCHPAWAWEDTLVGPGKDTHGTPVPTLW